MTDNKRTHRKFAQRKHKVLITDQMHSLFMKGLKKHKIDFDYEPKITPTQTMHIIERYTGLVVNSKMKMDKTFIDRAKNLQFVARAGSGMENVDVKYLDKKKIHAISSPEGNKDAVGEHTLGMLLSLLHNINKSDRELRKKIWKREENRGEELQGKTVGIIGYGQTGSAFAKKLKGMDVRVIAYDKYLPALKFRQTGKKNFSDEFVEEVDMKTIFEKADVVSLHIPLTKETEYLVDEKFLKKFKKTIFLLNTSRGKILRTNDLLKAIESGKVKKAGLDVFENENLQSLNKEEKRNFEELIKSDKVVLTPHIAGWSVESKEKIAEILLEKIKKIA